MGDLPDGSGSTRRDLFQLGAEFLLHQVVHDFEYDKPDNQCTEPLEKAKCAATDNRLPGSETPQVGHFSRFKEGRDKTRRRCSNEETEKIPLELIVCGLQK